MKKIIIIIIFAVILLGAAVFYNEFSHKQNNSGMNSGNNSPQNTSSQNAPTPNSSSSQNQNAQNNSSQNGFVPPLPDAAARVTKKPFGIYVTPQNSPVQPERFTGYHTGADFETFPNEQNATVAVHAVCNGTFRLKEYASGYGGVAVEQCTLNGSPITVIYGHLNAATITPNVGDKISAGQAIGDLGKGYSVQTDGERKHLHLGFHKGAAINILGYVQNKADLAQWIDPCLYNVCK